MTSSFSAPDGIFDRPINHVCYTVENIAAAAEFWSATFGAGPFFLVKPVPGELEHLRQTASWEPTLAFGQWGPIGVELMEIGNAEPATLAARLTAQGTTVSHVAYVSPTPEADSDYLESLGMPCFLRSRRGPVETTWHDAPLLGHSIEIHRETVFITNFFAAVAAAAEGWDGAEPLRTLPRQRPTV